MQAIADRLVKLIDDLEPAGDLNAKVERLVENELLKRLVRYELVDRRLFQKYGMSFDEFKQNRTVEREGYSFEVESDFWDWEMALNGIETIQDRLKTLKETGNEVYVMRGDQMTIQPAWQPSTLELTLIDIVRTLHPRRAVQVLDFARWLQTQPVSDEQLSERAAQIDMELEEKTWEQIYLANRDDFRTMAHQALVDLDAGETLEMVIVGGKVMAR